MTSDAGDRRVLGEQAEQKVYFYKVMLRKRVLHLCSLILHLAQHYNDNKSMKSLFYVTGIVVLLAELIYPVIT